MQAHISENGVLSIRPTNELESFALQSWLKSFNKDDGCTLEILLLDGKSTLKHSGKNPFLMDGKSSIIESNNLRPVIGDVRKNNNLNSIDCNVDRLSKDKTHFLPSDSKILDVVFEAQKPLSPIEVIEIIINDTDKEIKPHTITNAMQRLKTQGKVDNDIFDGVTKWFFVEVSKEKIRDKNETFYANDIQRIEFAKHLGYKTIDEAIKEVGSWEFEKQLKDHVINKE